MVVEVFPVPEMSLYDFARLKAVAAGRDLAVAISGVKSGYEVRQGGFAVAEVAAQVVAVRAGEWTFTMEARDEVGREETSIDLMAPASWFDW